MVSRQLEPQPAIDHAHHDRNATNPPMDIREHALLARLPEISVLEYTHGRLEQNEGARHQQPNNNVGMYWMIEEVEVVCHSDAESHASYHHHKAYDLDGDVPREGAVSEVKVGENAVGGQVDGDGAERVQDDEDDGHDACVAVAEAVEYFVGVVEVALLEVSNGNFFAEDHLWRWILC